MTQRFIEIGIFCIAAIATFVFSVFFFGGSFSQSDVSTTEVQAKDIESIAPIKDSFQDLSLYFLETAKEKGGVYAFSVLREASLGPSIDIHLLGHIIGDELYTQTGLDGMQYCTPDFRNACSHTIVIGALLEHGWEGVVDTVHDVCKKAPGGDGAYTMCFHGFGHGVLAYNEYDILPAVEMCSQLGTPSYDNREYVECIGGMIMEMMSGVHDRDLWLEKSELYLKDDDPLHICTSDLIPGDAKPICYIYVSPALFEAAGADLNDPDPAFFAKSFEYCDALATDDFVGRGACYGGLGKEFVVLARDRDIRDIHTMTDAQMRLVIEWCDLAQNKDGIKACLSHSIGSLYWGGENPVSVPTNFCSLMSDPELKGYCFGDLIGQVSYYVSESAARAAFCEMVPAEYQENCNRQLQ